MQKSKVFDFVGKGKIIMLLFRNIQAYVNDDMWYVNDFSEIERRREEHRCVCLSHARTHINFCNLLPLVSCSFYNLWVGTFYALGGIWYVVVGRFACTDQLYTGMNSSWKNQSVCVYFNRFVFVILIVGGIRGLIWEDWWHSNRWRNFLGVGLVIDKSKGMKKCWIVILNVL
jgi:hypothetical protein